ncbi:MAG: sigma-54 dependent transcriptional regulator [Thermoanaerobaculales bacterium]|nr:sigma-54 dependent transcriptional regulator [Thermoanaerobaculales bacterium]
MQTKQILIVDDDRAVTTSLALLLKQSGYGTVTAAGPEEALQVLADQQVDLVIQDMNFSRRTSGDEGLDLLLRIKGRQPHLPVILITAWGSVELAVQGVKTGASDFVTKPWTHEQIQHSVRTALGLAELKRMQPEEMSSRAELDSAYDFRGLIGEDQRFLRVLQVVGRVAATEAPVLITGESGTGKELVAEALWRNSQRSDRPFIKVNLGGIPTSLFESEMFGHVKGAFTDASSPRTGRFEAADGGALFLDEIGDLGIGDQVKLLRVLQDRTFERVGSSVSTAVDVRVISATNRDLPLLIEKDLFREDLLYRLNLIVVHLPALKERRGDVPMLVAHFLEGMAGAYRRPDLRIDGAAIDWLTAQAWPGNVRQLKHLIERTVLLTGRDHLTVDDFVLAERSSAGDLQNSGEGVAATRVETEPKTLDEIERQVILQAKERHGGNLTKVAEELGLSRGALYRRLEKHGIIE